MNELLVFVIFLSFWRFSNSFHPYFRVYSSSYRFSTINAGTDDEIRKEEQVLKLKQQVGSVLQSTLEQLGAAKVDPSIRSEIKLDSSSNRIERSVSNPRSQASNPFNDSAESKKLSLLGYSTDDLKILKDTVKSRLAEMTLPRPSVIPSVWMKKEYRDLLVSATLPRSSNQNNRIEDKKSSNIINGKTSARWVNPPSSQKTAQSDDSGEPPNERDDSDEGLQIWPSREEFKDMLLEESRLRVQAVGSWIAPLVRNENKWRFTLYDNWLKFLNEGFGDQMDILENEYTAELIDDEIRKKETETGKEKNMGKRRVISRKEEYDEFIKQQQEKIDAFLSEQSESKLEKIVGKKTRVPLAIGSGATEEEDIEKIFNKDNLFDEEDGEENDEIEWKTRSNHHARQPIRTASRSKKKQRDLNPLINETDEM